MSEETTETVVTETTTETETPTVEALQASVEKLTRSLTAEREAHKGTKSSLGRIGELEAALEAANAEKMTEQEKAVAAARKEAAGEVTSKVASRLLSERVRSLATGKFAEPSDALMFLKESGALAKVTMSDDLEIDDKPLVDALEELGKKRPHWLKASENDKTASAGDAGIGGQGNNNPKQITNLNDAIAARLAKQK